MTKATRDDFLATCERQYRDVLIKPLGKTVRIRSVTEAERLEIIQAMLDDGEAFQSYEAARYVQMSVVNDDGDLLFSEAEIEQIRKMPAAVVCAIYEEIDKAFEVRSDKENDRIEDAGKNSQTTQDDASQSA